MPRAGFTHVLIDTVADAYQRISPGGVEQTITLLGRLANASSSLRIFSATGALSVVQLA